MDDIAGTFLDDVLLSQVFITNYMQELSDSALKLYLTALLYKNHDNEVNSSDCRRFLSLEKEDFKAALLELSSFGLIVANNELSKFKLIDLKRQALDKYYRRKTAKSMQATVEDVGQSRQRSDLINSINNTYFNGMMGANWYQAIDSWFDEYGFDSAVVYQMFVDGAERNVLHGPNYLNAVARNYGQHKIKNFNDLAAYKEKRKKVNLIANQVKKALNKNMTSYDYKFIEKWYDEYGYDFDVIEVALRKSVNLATPSLPYFDKILANWHQAGIKTRAEAENIIMNEKNQAQASSYKHRKKSTDQHYQKKPSFQERDYDEDFFWQFYEFADDSNADNKADPETNDVQADDGGDAAANED